MRLAVAAAAGGVAAVAALIAYVLHRLEVDLAGVRVP